MELTPRFNPAKTTEALLYVTQRCHNVYNVLKVLYFADKEHMEKHGRFIFGDRYVAMKHGPVPSGAYDLVKAARGEWTCISGHGIAEVLSIDGNTMSPKREADLEFLSISEIEALDAAIAQYGHMPFDVLKAISHAEPSFKEADENDYISMETLVKNLSGGELIWDYLTSD